MPKASLRRQASASHDRHRIAQLEAPVRKRRVQQDTAALLRLVHPLLDELDLSLAGAVQRAAGNEL